MKTISKKELFEKLGETERTKILNTNHLVVIYKNGSVLYSYNKLVAAYANNDYYFTEYHDYSKTTSRWVLRYCGYDTTTRRKMIWEELATLIY